MTGQAERFSTVAALVVFVCGPAARGAEYYVSTTGDDANPGSLEEPFRTLQKAAEVIQAGDTCHVRAGRYREPLELNGVRGTRDAPVTFAAYRGERVVLDGTEKIASRWTRWKGDIYLTKPGRDVWQLFIEGADSTDGKLVHLARWPDASLPAASSGRPGRDNGSIWDMDACMRSTDRTWDRKQRKFVGRTRSGVICDPGAGGLAETGVDFTGAVAVLNIGHWLTWARPVTGHGAGRDTFEYDATGTRMAKYTHYYMLGLPCLDREGEWWYERRTGTVYLWAPGGADPNSLAVTGKVRDYNLRAKGCSFLRVRGLEFFATTFGLEDCDHVLVEDCRLLYPSTHKFALGRFDWVKHGPGGPSDNVMTYVFNTGDGPHGNVVRNCAIEYPNTPAICVNSPGSVVENCYMHDIEWDVNSSGGSGALPAGAGTTIRRNTIHTAGGSEGIRPGAGSTVELNHVWNMGLLQHDGSAINIGTSAIAGTVVRRNWVHDTNRGAIRFDSTASRFGAGGLASHNVWFRVAGGRGGAKFKGDRHLILGNTCFDSYLAVPRRFGDTAAHNRNTLVRNNLAEHLIEWNMGGRREGIPARCDHNLSGEGVVGEVLRDPANLDFRPRAASRAVDAGARVPPGDVPSPGIRLEVAKPVGRAFDIGAYESGDRDYWIPGRRLTRASTPVPPDGATGVMADADLMWLGGYRAASHEVYFGTSAKAVARAGRGSKEFRGSRRHNVFDPDALEPGATYHWRIDAVSGAGTVTGEVWSFTAEAPGPRKSVR